MKRCSKCSEEKELTDYCKDPRYRDGLAGECKPCRNERTKAWQKKNRERYLARGRLYALTHRERRRDNNRDYYRKNIGRSRARNAKKRARFINAFPVWCSENDAMVDEIAAKYLEARVKEQETGVAHHVDHIEPLQGKDRCGLHVPWNLRVIPAIDNLRKHNRPPEAFPESNLSMGS